MKRRSPVAFLLFTVTVVFLLVLAGCGQSQQSSNTNPASTPAPEKAKQAISYPQKDIIFVVPTTTSGAFDTFSRILAPYLEKYMPNKVNVVVKNVPGGNWALGIGEIYKAKPDGYTMGIINIPGNLVLQLTGKVDYDLRKMTWIGKLTSSFYVGSLAPKSRLKSFQDVIDAGKAGKLKVGVDSISTGSGLGIILLSQAAGLKPSIISHDGSTGAFLAAIRGDIDYLQFPFTTSSRFFGTGPNNEVTPIVVYRNKRYDRIPDVPTIGEMGYPGLADTVAINYLIATTPGVPEEIAAILREAFQKVIADPEFTTKLKETAKVPNDFGDAQEAARIVESSLESYLKYKEALVAALEPQKGK